MRMKLRGRIIALLLVLLPGTLYAHGEGVIRLGARSLPANGTLDVTGAKLTKNSTLTIELRGALAMMKLGEVKTDAKGEFTARFVLPSEAREGSYSVAAVAADGDVVARADLAITSAAPVRGMGGHTAMEPMPDMPSMPHATDKMLRLVVQRTAFERIVILFFIAACFLAAGLLLKPAGPSSSAPSYPETPSKV